MIRYALPIGYVVVMAATTAAATPHPTAQVLEVMRDNGCRLNTADAENAFSSRGLTPEDVSSVINSWAEQGLAGLDGSFFEIAPAICGAHGLAAEDAKGRADALYEFVRLNGCRMGKEEAEIKLRPAGFTKTETPILIDRLIADGRAQQEDPYIIVIGDAC
ncbi:hypothetical protein [Ruegeria sp. Ofav3-42]|uniref:hypothetical protein n=1 Tax=Ruegeria sp. Ofav3-42 TaxID=2917759 RepID=UPI001EF47453|nr:hypothetical protein [Ruegeria sp. Ofav3-42]MCG7519118.1 hypothetical protein [Ruegeria sp. Ofav3-42]